MKNPLYKGHFTLGIKVEETWGQFWAFQFNLNLTQFNVNPLIKLNLLELEFNSTYIAMLFIGWKHTKGESLFTKKGDV
jgi:hypothetical protein